MQIDAFAYFADEIGMEVLETVAIDEESSLSAGVILHHFVTNKKNNKKEKYNDNEKESKGTFPHP